MGFQYQSSKRDFAVAHRLAEKEMRNLIEASENARLRLNSTVTHIDEVEDGVQVTYLRKDGTAAELQGIFLVGADGKRGYVRKGYLEAKGITQSAGMSASLAGTLQAIHELTCQVSIRRHVDRSQLTHHPPHADITSEFPPLETWI